LQYHSEEIDGKRILRGGNVLSRGERHMFRGGRSDVRITRFFESDPGKKMGQGKRDSQTATAMGTGGGVTLNILGGRKRGNHRKKEGSQKETG